MKKLLGLFILATTISACIMGKFAVEKKDIVGEWKEIKVRKTKNSTVKNISDCSNDSLPKGSLYDFSVDGTYFKKGICPKGKQHEYGVWSYSDNILTLTVIDSTSKEDIEYKYSVSNQNKNQIKLSFVLFRKDASIIDYIDGYYVVLEKR